MASTEAEKRSAKKWIATRDNITIRLEKETGAAIRAAAAEQKTSVTQYILSCVQKAQAGESGNSGGIALPEDLQVQIEKHVSLTNETMEDFIIRAVRNTLDCDMRLINSAAKKPKASKAGK